MTIMNKKIKKENNNKKANIQRVTAFLLLMIFIIGLSACGNKDGTTKNDNPLAGDEQKSSGWYAYEDQSTGLYGYKNKAGEVVIAPTYLGAEDFYGGRAIVKMKGAADAPTYGVLADGVYGMIDPDGNFVIEPKGLLTRVDTWHYLYAEPSEFFGGYGPDLNSVMKRTLIDGEGNPHGTTAFYYVMPISEHVLLANDGNKSLFIDDAGVKLENFPDFYFPVTASMKDGSIIVRPLDDSQDRIHWILSPEGEIKDEIKLNEGIGDDISFTTNILSPYIGTSVFYPEVKLKNLEAQSKINQTILELAKVHENFGAEEGTIVDLNQVTQINYNLEVNFNIGLTGNVLTYDVLGYWYGFGAAHPNSFQNSYYFDSETGDQLIISDLFNSDSEWMDALITSIDDAFMSNDEMYLFIDHDTPKEQRLKTFKEGHFEVSLTNEGLKVYYPEYEIAPYAAGYPTFDIPYESLESFFNVKGRFYQLLFNQ